MFKKVSDKWRILKGENLKAALIAVGVSPEAAEEYLDDPNAIPTDLRRKLNEYVK